MGLYVRLPSVAMGTTKENTRDEIGSRFYRLYVAIGNNSALKNQTILTLVCCSQPVRARVLSWLQYWGWVRINRATS